jgi:hypothetical protein
MLRINRQHSLKRHTEQNTRTGTSDCSLKTDGCRTPIISVTPLLQMLLLLLLRCSTSVPLLLSRRQLPLLLILKFNRTTTTATMRPLLPARRPLLLPSRRTAGRRSCRPAQPPLRLPAGRAAALFVILAAAA